MKSATIVIPCLLVGGTEVATLTTVKALTQLGYKVQVIVLFEETDLLMLSAFSQYDIEICQLLLQRHSNYIGVCKLIVKLWRSLAGGRDLIWVQYMTPTLIPLLITRFRTRLLIACVHVAASHYKPLALMRLRFVARWWCDRFICVSDTTASALFGAQFAFDKAYSKVSVLHNALDENQINYSSPRDWRKELDIAKNTIIVGYVGRLAYNKGVDVLLQAISILVCDRVLLRCVLVGDGEDRNKLERMAYKLNISSYVDFVGAISRVDVYSSFKGFDIAVVPSREEGFGLSAIEAMACGVPLVASAVDALCELIIDGETGILVPSDDPTALATALSSLMKDSLMISRIKRDALSHVLDDFSFEGYKEGLSQILQNESHV